MDDAAFALRFCVLFVAAPVGMVSGVVIASRLRRSARFRATGKVLGATALFVAWELSWLGLLFGGVPYLAAWVVLQPLGVWMVWRAVRDE